ncbi:nucleotidyl transferase AbiEii/AbiGii toxin family protein [Streptacidiphilus jiangxiensis]|uniref:Nucleotidyl transferase AbiEii toxin, Type IV TA system n=1 Tax=Streptacidiphilus jiangxiensis TaxID=235985 RepID=A0A1H7IGG9_STRJI|nr:nucleotidyl transferase AbiEii/AbiGii toxin family protein [Streptacidiphilus jiangxiensis]SEK59735.1 Nucleotidyl transferase AbiEii toxin, Type IV TA system [Streptacidiphilus jiangxiensis]
MSEYQNVHDAWKQRWSDGEVPQVPLGDEARQERRLPLTLRPVGDERARQLRHFEPALKQYRNAFRAGDPAFADHDLARAWREARRAALDLVLAGIAASPWADSLVLRGSVLLRTWFGEAAREPGDLDFVVVPPTFAFDGPEALGLLDGVALAAQRAADAADGVVRFDVAGAVSDEIWTYERVPGRRLVLPWSAAGLPGGVVQLDFVFNEELPQEPVPTDLEALSAGSGTAGARLLAASPELSLAWKLVWWLGDLHPQGKDLYDAVLLAEDCTLDYELLGAAFMASDPSEATAPARLHDIADRAERMSHEWTHFTDEYPDLPQDLDALVDRLLTALAPTFADLPAQGEPEYPLRVRWMAHHIRAVRALAATTDLPALLDRMAAKPLAPGLDVVVLREVLGPGTYDIPTVRDLLYAHPSWEAHLHGHPRYASWLQERLDRL